MKATLETQEEKGVLQFREEARAGSENVDAAALYRDLMRHVAGEIRFDAGARALYATDASNYRQVPIGVVMPKSAADIVATVEAARRHGAPILTRGGGTSLAGQCCNVAVVMDASKHYNQILELDVEKRRARVQPGIVLDTLRNATREKGLTFGPDPATHDHCTLGGMIGNNSCGVHSVMAQFAGGGPRTCDNLEELEILTYDGLRMRVGRTSEDELRRIIQQGGRRGEIYRSLKRLRDKYAELIRARFPKIPRRVSGYNLDELLPERGFHVARALSGTESTCVIYLEATLELVEEPKARSLLVLGYPDVFSAGDHVCEIMEHEPIGLEGLDDLLIEYNQRLGMNREEIRDLPEGKGWLLVEFGGDSKGEADAKALKVMALLKKSGRAPTMKLFDDPKQEKRMWEVRESGLAATAFVPGMRDSWPGWEDSAVPPEKIGGYLRDLRALFDKYDLHPSMYGHFGNGCVHCSVDFDLNTQEGLEGYRAFVEEASDLVLSYGGSLSGEHGDGQSRGELLPKMFGPELVKAFGEFKAIWDPSGMMNPGKVVDPYPILSNLRLGPEYNPPDPQTHFQFPNDQGSFARAALRCVGVGKCRREEGGTMCPSYRVTRDEEHTTRGRAHLLFEMLRGEVLKDGWRDANVREALDLCLACKGCKAECPVSVDMATYKAEFLSHYYAGRLRPRAAYSMGLISWTARWASMMPGVANFFMQTPPFGAVLKMLGGIAAEREFPRFASQTFKDWFRKRRPRNLESPPVLLWPDTFCNHFHPHIAQAAVEVLEQAGFQVIVPRGALCCGRPLYDFGMLKRAKLLLKNVLEELRPMIRAGVPMVGLEPSCLAVFRDELPNLFPHDEDARRLTLQSFTLAEFLTKKAEGFALPFFDRRVLLHGHCHQKAIMKMDCDVELLKRMGVELTVLDSGCCGMAGSFGFEADKYEVSVKCGEQVLLPAVRQAGASTLVLADGFSCREQISQLTERKAVHLAEVLQMALRHETPSLASERELQVEDGRAAPGALLAAASAAVLGAAVIYAWKGKPKRGRWKL